MEHIPAWHAAKRGVLYPARVKEIWDGGLELELDLIRFAPGRSPMLPAHLVFERTVNPELARHLVVGDAVEVVLIEVSVHHQRLAASLPADPVWLTWNNETVRRLARHIRETPDTHLLPILADALEDAGCSDEALLSHCREPRPEASWSWAVELLATQQ